MTSPSGTVGWVPTTGRGSLPFATIRGEPLVALASSALEAAGARLMDFTTEAADLGPHPLVLHDPLCPLTPPAFLREAIELCVDEELVVVGVHPVSDTVKTVAGGVVGETVDRDRYWTVTSPVVLPASLVDALDTWPDTDDFARLVESLRGRAEVRFLPAPQTGRRVEDESAIELLEVLAADEGSAPQEPTAT